MAQKKNPFEEATPGNDMAKKSMVEQKYPNNNDNGAQLVTKGAQLVTVKSILNPKTDAAKDKYVSKLLSTAIKNVHPKVNLPVISAYMAYTLRVKQEYEALWFFIIRIVLSVEDQTPAQLVIVLGMFMASAVLYTILAGRMEWNHKAKFAQIYYHSWYVMAKELWMTGEELGCNEFDCVLAEVILYKVCYVIYGVI